MSMTKKQARAFVEDENNWKTVFCKRPFRSLIFIFRGHAYLKVQTWHFSEVRNSFSDLDPHYRMANGIWETNRGQMELIGEGLSNAKLADIVWELDKDEA